MKRKNIKKRLYRALRANELILTSQLIQDHKLADDFVPLNEAYSHIVPSYKLRETEKYRTVFSFTEDLAVAKKLLKNHPDTYVNIGYIDIEMTDAFTTNNINILFAMPVYRLSDWVELMSFSYDNNKCISNLNYSCKDIHFVNAIIYSRWSAMSLATANKEYLLICDNLIPSILDDTTQANTSNSIPLTAEKDFLVKNYKNNVAVVSLLEKQLLPLDISKDRKELLLTKLKELKKYYKSKVA